MKTLLYMTALASMVLSCIAADPLVLHKTYSASKGNLETGLQQLWDEAEINDQILWMHVNDKSIHPEVDNLASRRYIRSVYGTSHDHSVTNGSMASVLNGWCSDKFSPLAHEHVPEDFINGFYCPCTGPTKELAEAMIIFPSWTPTGTFIRYSGGMNLGWGSPY